MMKSIGKSVYSRLVALVGKTNRRNAPMTHLDKDAELMAALGPAGFEAHCAALNKARIYAARDAALAAHAAQQKAARATPDTNEVKP